MAPAQPGRGASVKGSLPATGGTRRVRRRHRAPAPGCGNPASGVNAGSSAGFWCGCRMLGHREISRGLPERASGRRRKQDSGAISGTKSPRSTPIPLSTEVDPAAKRRIPPPRSGASFRQKLFRRDPKSLHGSIGFTSLSSGGCSSGRTSGRSQLRHADAEFSSFEVSTPR